MKVIRTASFKLSLSEQERETLLHTIDLYTKAYNYSCQVGYEKKIYNSNTLHHAVYRTLKKDLPAQLAISSRMLAADSLKGLLTKQVKHNKLVKQGKKKPRTFRCPKSKRMAIRFDRNSFTLWFDKQKLSILTHDGRLRLPIKWDRYSIRYKDWKHTSATLTFKKNKFFLNVQFEKKVEEVPANGTLVGIDRGIKKLAVTSNNQFFQGGEIQRISHRYERLRASLQKKGSKSAKRHLCRLSGKEQRFRTDANHNISKKIIDSLNPGDTIVLEDLSGIRNLRLRKKQRKKLNSWNFYQLELFLIYKAEAKGIHIEYVDPHYTSQRCSKCGFIAKSNRKSQSDFRCGKCCFTLNADLNAARNIRDKATILESYTDSSRVVVNQPIAAPPSVGAASLQSCTVGN